LPEWGHFPDGSKSTEEMNTMGIPKLQLNKFKELPQTVRTTYTVGIVSLIVSFIALILVWTNRGSAAAVVTGA
jgi:uncharacterized membrane protein